MSELDKVGSFCFGKVLGCVSANGGGLMMKHGILVLHSITVSNRNTSKQ